MKYHVVTIEPPRACPTVHRIVDEHGGIIARCTTREAADRVAAALNEQEERKALAESAIKH